MSKLNRLKLASLALAGLSAVASGSAVAGSMTVDSNGGIEIFELDNPNYWFKIGGRLHLDTAMYEGGEHERSKFPSGSHIRRARITLKGGVGNNWVYKLDIDHYDAASRQTSNPGRAQFGEAFIAYNGCRNVWFALGQVSMPYSLEGWASANETMFMENSLAVSSFAPNYLIGAYAEWHNHMFTLAGAIGHPQAGTRQTGDVYSTAPAAVNGTGPNGSDPGSDTISFGGRATFSPVHDHYTVYHAGASYRYQNVHDRANVTVFGTPPVIRSRQAPFLFTNIPPNSVENYQTVGFELAGRWGPFMATGEYVHTSVEREGSFSPNDPRNPGDDLTFYGYYVSLSYVLTGETKEYDFVSGTFGRVHPKSAKGAWEVAVRHGYVKLLDVREISGLPVPWNTPHVAAPAALPNGGGILPNNMPGNDVNDFVGNAHHTDLGVTWWVNDNVRFLANYSRMSYPDGVDINGFGLRAAVNW